MKSDLERGRDWRAGVQEQWRMDSELGKDVPVRQVYQDIEIGKLLRRLDDLHGRQQMPTRTRPEFSIEETEKAAEDVEWECDTCGKRFTYGTQCEHYYFDSQVYDGPLPRKPRGETAGQTLWREAGEDGDA